MDEPVPIAARLCVAVVLLGSGVAVSLVTRRAADGRLVRNAVAGIRTRATMTSEGAWRAGHVAAYRCSDLAGAAFGVTGLAILWPSSAGRFTAVALVGTVMGTALLLLGVRRAGRAARAAGSR